MTRQAMREMPPLVPVSLMTIVLFNMLFNRTRGEPMKRMLILLVTLALAGTAVVAKDQKADEKKKPAKAAAQEQPSPSGLYQYLPEEMGSQAAFTQADYIALRFTAYNSRSQRIAAKLVSASMQADARSDSLVINAYVDLTEKERTNYLGDGKFNYPAEELAPMMQEGVDFIDKLANLYFAGLDKRFLVINLYMKGALIGSWSGGQLKVLATGK